MGIFGKTRELYQDFSSFGTDLHSHILPGMDDGAPTLAESIRMLNELAKAGFKKIITTPHVNSAIYPNTKDQILGQLYHLKEIIAQENIPIEAEATGEYHMDYELLGKVQAGEVIPFGRENYLLIELPFQKPSFSYLEILFQIQQLGYMIVIAHAERYDWLMGRMKQYEELKVRSILFQLNLNSLNGLYGFPAKHTANQLIDAGMFEFIGSDAHHAGHVQELRKVLNNKHFIRLAQSNLLLNTVL